MKIIAHRGYWKVEEEKNTIAAFERAFIHGYGVETDLRDYCGEVVISHDLPRSSDDIVMLKDFLDVFHRNAKAQNILALNIKADGLQNSLLRHLAGMPHCDYFVFDMSIPDTLAYQNVNMPFFSRQSEYEAEICLYENAKGVWLDCFVRDWFDNNLIINHLDKNKQVCLVSPELHGREHLLFWERLLPLQKEENLLLCTDYPDDAFQFFNK